MESIAIAEALFGAFVSGDDEKARELCAPDAQAVQNHAPPMSLDELLAFSASVRHVMPDYHYAEVVRTTTASGFIEEHSVRGTLPGGEELRLAACVIGEVRDGRITHLREYVDSFAARGLVKALAKAASTEP